MKDWAKPYVLQRTAESLAESVKDEAEREQWLVLKSKVLEDEEVVYDELTSCLNCQFGNEVGDPQDFFYRVFGSVLADLPEEVFKTLSGIKNLFFLFSPKPGAETKTFELKNDIKEGELLQVVVFPSASGSLPQMVLRGEIVRELVQAYTSLGIIIEEKDRIDSIAIGWGFREEIKTIREYKKEKKFEEKQAEGKRQAVKPEARVAPSKTQEGPVLIMKGEKPSEQTIYELKQGVTSIGRRSGNDIVLTHILVSRRHAEICLEGDSHFVYDAASTNGTRVNGQSIHKQKLSDGDVVQIGPFTFTFKAKGRSPSSQKPTRRKDTLP